MKSKQNWILAAIVVLLMGGTVALLARLKANQKLGAPGVKTASLPDSRNLEVLLPELVLDFTSEKLEQDKIVLEDLPKDTSFGRRRYTTTNFWTEMNVVLMGSDRTSIHKPQFCLTGQGWKIDSTVSQKEIIRVDRPYSYDLEVNKVIATRELVINGQPLTARGIYVYWFVADDALAADPTGIQRMVWTARELLQSGTLQRWAYVSCFTVCMPGQEDATFERMKKLIAASVPDFQLTPKPQGQTASAQK